MTELHRPTRRQFLVGAAALTTLTATGVGCGDDDEAASESDSTTTSGPASASAPLEVLPLTYVTAFGYTIAFTAELVAEQAGIYERHGLEVTIEPGRGVAGSFQQLAAGNATVVRAGGADIALAASGAEVPFTSISTICQSTTFHVVSGDERPVPTAADLAGKRVGLTSRGGNSESLLDALLATQGIDPSSVERVLSGNTAASFGLVEQDRIDAFFTVTTPLVELEDSGQPIVSFPVAEVDPFLGQGFAGRTSQVNEDPEPLRRFNAAIKEAAELVLADDGFEATFEMLSKYDIVEIDEPDVIKEALRRETSHWTENGADHLLRHDADQWAASVALLERTGAVTGIEASDIYTNDLLPA